MNFKVFAAFFLTLLAVHASTSTPLGDGTKTIVATILEAALEGASVLLQAARKYVNDFDEHEEAIRAKILDRAVQVAFKLNHVFLGLVDDLKYNTTANGQTVIKCIEAEESTTQVAIKRFANSVGNCLNKEVNVILYQVNVMLKQLDALYVDVKKPVDKLRDCTSSDTTCFMELAQGAMAVLEKVKPIVKEDISVLRELIKTVLQDISQCRLDLDAKSGAQEIFNEYVVCLYR